MASNGQMDWISKMPRELPEWIGKTDNTSVPPRVQQRILERQDFKCAVTKIHLANGVEKQLDHIIALVNGGENRESNLQWITTIAHKAKTKADVAQKAKDRRIAAKHNGLHKPKSVMPGSKNSKWKKKMDGTTVLR